MLFVGMISKSATPSALCVYVTSLVQLNLETHEKRTNMGTLKSKHSCDFRQIIV